ncbi:MAG: TldD/PmbA family protein [Planctomycetota bacterium]
MICTRYSGLVLRVLLGAWVFSGAGFAAEEHPLLAVLQDELTISMEKLVAPDGSKPYFLQYVVTDEVEVGISATLGGLTRDDEQTSRLLDVDLRVGDYKLDNTRQIRDPGAYLSEATVWGTENLPLNGDPLTTRQAVWLRTDRAFKAAVKRLAQVKTNLKVKVEEEDPSDDFSKEKPSVQIQPWLTQPLDRAAWADRIRNHAKRFRSQPKIFSSSVALSGSSTNRLVLNSEGSRLQFGQGWWRIGIHASTIADDGMELWQYNSLDAHTPDGLPDDNTIAKAVDRVIADLLALRDAPIVEPYTGPAILLNRASGVFFHEIFGHRIEGHRQKDVEEGQTFAKKLGQPVLPTFLTVVDDPSLRQFKGTDLNGFYPFDDECVPSQPARLVEDGILKTFLMSRSPTRGINFSNGHGRRQPGSHVVARQGNLMLDSKNQVSFSRLREMLIEEARKQNKPFGLFFADISGGYTMTQRYEPQAFKVLPIMVYKVYVEDRPDELVRGVDIVGTPLTCFSQILATGDDPDIFNGICGAESGMVPVSAISPSILVEQVEVEKKEKGQDRPPILPSPISLEAAK